MTTVVAEGRTCTQCGEWKPAGEFAKNERYRGGLASFCKVCKNAQRKAWRARKRAELPPATCERCGGEFQPSYDVVKANGRQRFCSDRCRALHLGGKGGRYIGWQGYVYVLVGRDHPMATPGTPHALEHRLVMAELVGRPLVAGEVVHHVNGVRHDNRPENLMLFASHEEHMRHHREQKGAGVRLTVTSTLACGCIRQRHGRLLRRVRWLRFCAKHEPKVAR